MNLRSFKKHWPAIFIIAVVLSGCQVMLIGAYDQVTDQGIQQVQTQVSTMFVKIEKNITSGTPDSNRYANFKNTYDNIEGEIKSLKIRAAALPKYQIISSQINALDSNIALMEKQNKDYGFANLAVVKLIDTTLQIQFSAMVTLQNGLKRQKTTATKPSASN